jgi:hypothetical protein
MFAIFNRPTSGVNGRTVTRRFLLSAFDSADSRSRVDLSVMNWYDDALSEAIAAVIAARELEVRGVTGNGQEDPPPGAIAPATAALFSGRGVAANLKPDGFLNHSKFVLFRAFDFQRFRSRGVGMQVGPVPSTRGPALYMGSANVGEEDKHNAGVLMPLTSAMRDEVQTYFDDLLYSARREAASPAERESMANPPDNRYRTVESPVAKLYFYPRRPFQDTLEGVIKNIQHYSDDGATSLCQIMIVSPRWRTGRNGIAEALERIYVRHRPRARISVVSRSPTDEFLDGTAEMSPAVEEVLRRCATLHYQASHNGVNIHSKYLLVDAPYKQPDGGYRHEQLVFVGSPNLTGAAIGHWEMIAKLKQGAWNAFSLDFQHLKQYATVAPIPPIG